MNEIVESHISKMMDALFPNGGGMVNHERVAHVLKQTAEVAYREGRNNVLLSLLTADDVAAQFGVTPRRIRALARARHARVGIGWQVPGTSQWLFLPEEVDALRPGLPGRPPQRSTTP